MVRGKLMVLPRRRRHEEGREEGVEKPVGLEDTSERLEVCLRNLRKLLGVCKACQETFGRSDATSGFCRAGLKRSLKREPCTQTFHNDHCSSVAEAASAWANTRALGLPSAWIRASA